MMYAGCYLVDDLVVCECVDVFCDKVSVELFYCAVNFLFWR